MVALSTEILAPIDQTGCLTAISGVAARMVARSAVRKGPPEAVNTIFSISAGSLASSAWKTALCSESQGSSLAPVRAASAVTISPAQTRLSLLASARVPPRSSAASVERSPAAPTIAAMVQSTGRAAASTTASGPAAVSMPVPASASRRAPSRDESATTARRAPNCLAWAARAATSLPATSASIA